MLRNGSRWRNGILKTGSTARGSSGNSRDYGRRWKELHSCYIRRRSVALSQPFWFSGYKQKRTTSNCWESKTGQHALLVAVFPRPEPRQTPGFDLLKSIHRCSLLDVLSHHSGELQSCKEVLVLARQSPCSVSGKDRDVLRSGRDTKGLWNLSDADEPVLPMSPPPPIRGEFGKWAQAVSEPSWNRKQAAVGRKTSRVQVGEQKGRAEGLKLVNRRDARKDSKRRGKRSARRTLDGSPFAWRGDSCGGRSADTGLQDTVLLSAWLQRAVTLSHAEKL